MLKTPLFRFALLLVALTVMSSASIARADTFGTGANRFTLDFVPISASTNPTEAQANDTSRYLVGFGIVEYNYRMGVYEVTNDQWNRFVATYGTPTGNPSAAYDEEFYDWGTGTTDVPTNMVTWYEAAQFVNWLNTSTGHQAAYKFTGTQGESDYTFATWDAADAWGGTNLYRHKDAYYFLPDEDEWFKAAYWNGSEIQDYATKPGETLHQGDGISGTGWNYYEYGYPPGPWDVGSGSEELNDTYDMMGNNWEWVKSPWDDPSYNAGSLRGFRGGCWYESPGSFRASYRYLIVNVWPIIDDDDIVFRVASIPEPSTITLLVCGALAVLSSRRRRR